MRSRVQEAQNSICRDETVYGARNHHVWCIVFFFLSRCRRKSRKKRAKVGKSRKSARSAEIGRKIEEIGAKRRNFWGKNQGFRQSRKPSGPSTSRKKNWSRKKNYTNDPVASIIRWLDVMKKYSGVEYASIGPQYTQILVFCLILRSNVENSVPLWFLKK